MNLFDKLLLDNRVLLFIMDEDENISAMENVKENILRSFSASLSSAVAVVSTARYTVWPNGTGVTRGPLSIILNTTTR